MEYVCVLHICISIWSSLGFSVKVWTNCVMLKSYRISMFKVWKCAKFPKTKWFDLLWELLNHQFNIDSMKKSCCLIYYALKAYIAFQRVSNIDLETRSPRLPRPRSASFSTAHTNANLTFSLAVYGRFYEFKSQANFLIKTQIRTHMESLKNLQKGSKEKRKAKKKKRVKQRKGTRCSEGSVYGGGRVVGWVSGLRQMNDWSATNRATISIFLVEKCCIN